MYYVPPYRRTDQRNAMANVIVGSYSIILPGYTCTPAVPGPWGPEYGVQVSAVQSGADCVCADSYCDPMSLCSFNK